MQLQFSLHFIRSTVYRALNLWSPDYEPCVIPLHHAADHNNALDIIYKGLQMFSSQTEDFSIRYSYIDDVKWTDCNHEHFLNSGL